MRNVFGLVVKIYQSLQMSDWFGIRVLKDGYDIGNVENSKPDKLTQSVNKYLYDLLCLEEKALNTSFKLTHI